MAEDSDEVLEPGSGGDKGRGLVPIHVGSCHLVRVLEAEARKLEFAPLNRQVIVATNRDYLGTRLKIDAHRSSVRVELLLPDPVHRLRIPTMARPLPQYRFLDRWDVPAPIEDVYDVVGDVLAYPSWWGDVFLAATGDPGPPAPGRATSVVARGFLPYKLQFTLTCLETERPGRIHSQLTGDFEGTGTWLLQPAAHGGTAVTLDWRPQVGKSIVRAFTPIARPLFRKNHTWTMVRGQQHIIEYLERRRSDSEAFEAGP